MALIVLLVCYLFLTMVSCSPAGERFHIQGTISGAEDSTLVLEAMTLNGVITRTFVGGADTEAREDNIITRP